MKYLLWIITVCCAVPAVAADTEPVGGVFGKAPLKLEKTIRTVSKAEPSASLLSTPYRSTLTKDFTVGANDMRLFELDTDLSGVENVGISITTLSDPNSRLTKVRIGVAFAAPGDWYILSSMILCSSFYYFDHGGAVVPVFGPFMKLAIFNDGSTPVKITQLSVYAVAH